MQVVIKWPLRNFAYGTTAVLSWHVQNFMAIECTTMRDTKTNVPSILNYDGKVIRVMGP